MVLVETLADKVVIWVYAYIGFEFDGERLQRILFDLQGNPALQVRMHCYGGDVIEGNLIFNQILTYPGYKELQIDGICASMATIISQAFDKVTIVQNGFMMIHAPSGGAYGNAGAMESAAKLLRLMEGQFNTVYAKRSGNSEEDTAKWMDGQDYWLSPQEALDNGLVDEIVPSFTESPPDLTLETVTALGAKAVYTRFAASLESAVQPPKINNNSKMDKQKLIDKYKLTGVTKDTPDEEFQTALEAHVDGLADKASNLETSVEETVEGMVAAAVGVKITAKQKDTFLAVGKSSGIKALASVLDAIKPYASINGQIQTGEQKPAEVKKDWNWDKYQKEDPKALAELEKTNFEAFAILYEAHYGKRPVA